MFVYTLDSHRENGKESITNHSQPQKLIQDGTQARYTKVIVQVLSVMGNVFVFSLVIFKKSMISKIPEDKVPSTPKYLWERKRNVHFSSVAQSCPTLCNPMDYSTPGLPVHHQLLELTQTHVHRVSDTIQPSHPLSSPSSPTFKLSQHQSLFKGVSSSHQVDKVLEFQLQHQSFQ